MKISPKTLSLLQSFSSISSSIIVKAGSKLATRNVVNSIQVRATVEEVFPKQFAIYDLNQLLSLISLSNNPDIEFGDKSLIIRPSDVVETEYFYADESLITAPKDKPPAAEDVYTFKLTPDDVNTIIKTAGIISATMLNIISDKGKVILSINDPKISTAHSYKKQLGVSDLTFSAKMSIDSFKVIPENYTVRIGNASAGETKVPVFIFEAVNSNLTYLIAADSTSKV